MKNEDVIHILNEMKSGYQNLMMCLESAKSDTYMYYVKALEQSITNAKIIEEIKKQNDRGNMNTEVFPDCSIMCYLAESEKR
jgi:hypothetical protein